MIGFGAGEPDFPTPDYIVEAAAAACRDPRFHRYTPAGGLPELREAIAAKTARDSGLRGQRRPRCWSPTAASRRSTRRSPTLLDPGDEVLLPAPYWTTYPESIRLAGGVPVEVPTDERHGYLATRRAARGRADTAHEGAACSSRPPTRPAPSTRPSRSRRSGAGRSSAASGSSPTRSTSTWSTATRGSPRCRSWCPSSPTGASCVNGVAKTYAMTGWRVGWLIGPADVVKAATNLQSHATSNVANVARSRRWPRSPATFRGGDDARGVRPAPADHRPDAERDPGRDCPEPMGAFYVYPSVKGCSVGRSAAAGRSSVGASCASWSSRRPRSRWCPGEAFGTPGYVRLSYALGDDDLVEGVEPAAASCWRRRH